MTDDKENVFSKYVNKASRTLKDSDRVSKLLEQTKNKLSDITKDNRKMREFVDIIKTFISMVKSSFSGANQFSWQTILLITAGLIYFITPIDLIPDFIPALGLSDDVSVIFFIYKSLKEDIDNYRHTVEHTSY